MDLIELTEAFLAAKLHAFSPNTRRAYRSDLVACARLLPRIPLAEITVAHLRLFLDATADLAPTTLARRKAGVCGWWEQEIGIGT
jgi:site-specific recombinase XerD